MKKQAKPKYPEIERLGIKIYEEPIAHVKWDDVYSKLTKEQSEKLSEYFGVQTCVVVDGRGCPYAWDVEAVLVRIFSGKLQGTQLEWD